MNMALISNLLALGSDLDPALLFPAIIPQAAKFAVTDPYAFSIATCLDRGTRAEIIWTIPYDLRERLGHLDPSRVYQMSIDELRVLVMSLTRKPRYVNAAPRTIFELTRIVVEECGGEAAKIWAGRPAAQVRQTFLRIHGVGPGIANMAVLLIEKAFGIRFSDIDRRQMDIKPDVHTVRVLYRLGLSANPTDTAAIAAARNANPRYPGELDGILWHIGREWCSAIRPQCSACPVTSSCPKAGVA
jgi:endonuclease III